MPRICTCFALYLAAIYALYRPKALSISSSRSGLGWLSGHYDPLRVSSSLVNLIVNILCMACSFDFVYRAHLSHSEHDLTFCRTGSVAESSARLLCRTSSPTSIMVTICSPDGACIDFHAESLSSTDNTAAFDLAILHPDTTYTYIASHGHRGSFTTRRPGSHIDTFTILSTSCMKPNWPYSATSHPLRILGLEYLNQYVERMVEPPSAMLFLGDFICELPLNHAVRSSLARF
jgi:alkaline phosphatase D